MSNQPFQPPFQPPVQLTPAQQAANTVVQIISQTFQIRVQNFKRASSAVWNNPNATPMDVVAAMGTQAVAIFTASGQEATLLNMFLPSLNLPTTIPAGFAFVSNPDGSAVLTKA